MKICIYIDTKTQRLVERSGVGRAVHHQKKALETVGAELVDKMEEADVVHLNTVFPDSYNAAKKARKMGKALVIHAHSTKEDFRGSYICSDIASGLFKKWITYFYGLGDVIITPSEYSKKLLLSYGIKKEIFAVSNGIDLSSYRRSAGEGRKFREKYGFSDSDKVIMSAGLLIRRKGVADFTELARFMPEYRFIWFGSAPLSLVGGEVRRAVKKAPRNLNYAGYVEKREIQAALSGSDLFLFPSYEETEGIAVLEALAMKTPVLVRDIPVYDGWLGFSREVWRARDIGEFERMTRNILKKRLPDITEGGYAAAKRKCIENTGRELLKAYERAIELNSAALRKK